MGAGDTLGLGLSANALVGGSRQRIVLQPLVLPGSRGLNVGAGVARLTVWSAGGD